MLLLLKMKLLLHGSMNATHNHGPSQRVLQVWLQLLLKVLLLLKQRLLLLMH